MEKTLVLIKPDAFGKNHTGEILKIYEAAGLKIVAAKAGLILDAIDDEEGFEWDED